MQKSANPSLGELKRETDRQDLDLIFLLRDSRRAQGKGNRYNGDKSDGYASHGKMQSFHFSFPRPGTLPLLPLYHAMI